MAALDNALEAGKAAWKKAIKGEKVLHSNSAISKVAAGALNNGLGGAEVAYRILKNPDGREPVIKSAFEDTFKKGGQYDYGKIAGSYIGVSAAARIASGGGVTKDQHGNTNLIGVPFI